MFAHLLRTAMITSYSEFGSEAASIASILAKARPSARARTLRAAFADSPSCGKQNDSPILKHFSHRGNADKALLIGVHLCERIIDGLAGGAELMAILQQLVDMLDARLPIRLEAVHQPFPQTDL